MIDLMKQFFRKRESADDATVGVRDPQDIHVATCALLLEMAHIDDEFSESEKETIISALKKEYDLSNGYIQELMREAAKEREESVDLWRFAREINRHYTADEKKQVIEMIWEIAYADERLDKHEDYLVHKLANLLRLDHHQLIEAKLKITARSSNRS